MFVLVCVRSCCVMNSRTGPSFPILVPHRLQDTNLIVICVNYYLLLLFTTSPAFLNTPIYINCWFVRFRTIIFEVSNTAGHSQADPWEYRRSPKLCGHHIGFYWKCKNFPLGMHFIQLFSNLSVIISVSRVTRDQPPENVDWISC